MDEGQLRIVLVFIACFVSGALSVLAVFSWQTLRLKGPNRWARPQPSLPPVAITPSPFSVFVDNHPEVGLSHAARWVLAISHDAVLVHDDKERRLVWVPMKDCRLKLADS